MDAEDDFVIIENYGMHEPPDVPRLRRNFNKLDKEEKELTTCDFCSDKKVLDFDELFDKYGLAIFFSNGIPAIGESWDKPLPPISVHPLCKCAILRQQWSSLFCDAELDIDTEDELEELFEGPS